MWSELLLTTTYEKDQKHWLDIY